MFGLMIGFPSSQSGKSPAARNGDRIAIGVLGLAAVLRLAAIFGLRSYLTTETAYEHHVIASNLVTGLGFSFPFFGPLAPTSQQAPFVPLLLAACYAMFGVGHPLALLLFQVLATVASVATVYGVSEIAGSIGGDRPRLLAGLGCAVYPAFIISVTHIQAVPFVTAWLVLMVLWGFRTAEDFRPRNLVMLGVWAALGALTDPILLLPAALTLGYLGIVLKPRAGWSGVARCVGLMASVVMLATMPWTIRNWVVHQRLVPIKDSFWYVLWQGNGPEASGTDKLMHPQRESDPQPSVMDLAGRHRMLLRERRRSVSVDSVLPAEFRARLAQLPTEIERMDAFGVLIRDFLRENPGHYLRMCWRRLNYFIAFDPTNPKSSHPLYRLSYLATAALGLVGVVVAGSDRRLLTLIYGGIAGIALPSILIITSARFRLPAEAFLIVLGAVGVARLMSALDHRVGMRPAG